MPVSLVIPAAQRDMHGINIAQQSSLYGYICQLSAHQRQHLHLPAEINPRHNAVAIRPAPMNPTFMITIPCFRALLKSLSITVTTWTCRRSMRTAGSLTRPDLIIGQLCQIRVNIWKSSNRMHVKI